MLDFFEEEVYFSPSDDVFLDDEFLNSIMLD